MKSKLIKLVVFVFNFEFLQCFNVINILFFFIGVLVDFRFDFIFLNIEDRVDKESVNDNMGIVE